MIMNFMNISYFFCCFLFLFFFLFYFTFMYLFGNSFSVLFSYVFFVFNGCSMYFLLYFSFFNLFVVLVVLFVSFMIYLYINYYMKCDINLLVFLKLLFFFVFSMFMFLVMPSIFGCLFGWDGLGLTSYFLVIYYNNIKSLNSGLFTIMINRLGDFFILLSLSFTYFFDDTLFFSCYLYFDFGVLLLFLMISSMTKSAQMPFSSWLPKAMSAPTPVSSLVHSSTLVISGFYLIFNFNYYYCDLNFFLVYFSILTSFLSCIIMMYEFDLKKLVAMTTLTQISYMFIGFGLGFSFESFFHMLVHAMYKSILFMCSGYLIYFNFGNQDFRFFNIGAIFCPMFSKFFFMLNMSSIGFPFFGGFYSKDGMIGMFLMSEINLVYILFFYASLFFFFLSTFRILHFVFNMGSSVIIFNDYFNLMIFVIFFMFFFMVFSGHFFFLFFNNYDMVYLNLYLKVVNFYYLLFSFYLYVFYFRFCDTFYLVYYLFYFVYMEKFYNYYIFNNFIYTFCLYILFIDSWLNIFTYKDFFLFMAYLSVYVNLFFFSLSVLMFFMMF
uniref:NADH dehydrogenase subunit 5 n=1 Tax=Parasacculina yatsui TaxID=2836420 RepID=UPI002551DEA0|nr:NADH dehydrogenase subunit 5 [Parasacculina yatsui]WGU20844.1 NADH dehydrogenase subunit 5 [Parasacculina yatsui]